jgi:hypothetical protein
MKHIIPGTIALIFHTWIAVAQDQYQSVANNAALSALPSTFAAAVIREGFTTLGDAPPVLYTPSANCPYPGRQPDNGACVASADAKYWVGNFKGMVAVPEIWGAPHNGIANDAPAINEMFASAVPTASYGLVCKGTAYVLTSGVMIANPVHFSGCGQQSTNFAVAGAITGFTITASGVVFENAYLTGSRTSGQVGISQLGSTNVVRNVQANLFDTAFLQPVGAGFKNRWENILGRNAASYFVALRDGVGPVVDGAFYDTDGPWYTGSYRVPTGAAILLETEGALIENYDIIHGGTGLLITANAADHPNGPIWAKIGQGYFDSGVGPGVVISNRTSGAILIKGTQFEGMWSATNTVGFYTTTDATSLIDTVMCTGCQIHNNSYDGVKLTGNTFRVSFDGAQIGGNDAPFPSGWPGIKTSGIYCNIEFLQSSAVALGLTTISGGQIGRIFGWTTQPNYNICENVPGLSILINGTYLDGLGVLTANLSDPNNDFQFSSAINVDPTSGWSHQSGGSSYSLAQGARVNFPAGSGLVILNDQLTGSTATILFGGQTVNIVAQTKSTFVNSARPPSGRIGVYWNAGTSSYQMTNNSGSSEIISSWDVRIRSVN